jgi:hypothetical protein
MTKPQRTASARPNARLEASAGSSPQLTDQQIECLVSQICEPDRVDECDALQVLLDEMHQALIRNSDDLNAAIDQVGWILIVARARAFAMFPEEMEARVKGIRTRLFGVAPASPRRKPLPTRKHR